MRFGFRMRQFHFLCMAGLLLLGSCGGKFFPPDTDNNGGGGNTNSGNYLYVANSGTNPGSIAGFSIANSKLNALSGSPFSLGSVQPTALALTPKDTFLYVASSSVGGIYLYTINSDGTLAVGNGGNPVATGISPSGIEVDTTGNWLIAVQDTGSNALAYVFGVNTSTGALTAQGNAVTLDIGSPIRIAFTPNDQIIYVSLGTGGVDILSFASSNGTLNAPTQILNPKVSNNSDQGIAVDPTGTYLFVTETGNVVSGSNGLRILKIASNGGLTELSTSPVQTGLGPSQVLVTASGSYVYVANRTDGTVSGFALSANGALTPLSGSPYTTGSAPVDIAEDNTGTYIAVACASGNPDLQVFSIDTTSPGKLDTFASTTTGTDPTLASAIVATK